MSVIKAANRHDVELADLLMEIKNANGELIAKDAQYHKGCHDIYCKEEDEENSEDCDEENSKEDVHVYDTCFVHLTEEIDDDLIYKKKPLK